MSSIIGRDQIIKWVGALTAALAAVAAVAAPSTAPSAADSRPSHSQPATRGPAGPTTRPIKTISITLHEKGVSADRLLDALAAQCEGRLTVNTQALPPGDSFSIDVDREAFWPAVRKIGLLLDLDYVVAPEGGVTIAGGKGGFDLTSASPQAILKVQRVQWTHGQGFEGENAHQTTNCYLIIAMAASPDAIGTSDLSQLEATKAVDERGNDFKSDVQMYGEKINSYGQPSRVARGQTVIVATISAPQIGKRIVEFDGHFTVEVGEDRPNIDRKPGAQPAGKVGLARKAERREITFSFKDIPLP